MGLPPCSALARPCSAAAKSGSLGTLPGKQMVLSSEKLQRNQETLHPFSRKHRDVLWSPLLNGGSQRSEGLNALARAFRLWGGWKWDLSIYVAWSVGRNGVFCQTNLPDVGRKTYLKV